MIAMRLSLLKGGAIILNISLLLTITLIGAIIGIPLIIIGSFMTFASIFIPATRVDKLASNQSLIGETEPQIRCHKCSALNPEYALCCNIYGNKL